MKRWIPAMGLALALLAVGTVRPSDARVSVNLNFGGPDYYYAPAPVLVYDAWGDPCYAYGGYYYRCDDDGYWLRSRDQRGPFVSVGFDVVPRVVVGRVHGRSYGYARYRPWSEMHREWRHHR